MCEYLHNTSTLSDLSDPALHLESDHCCIAKILQCSVLWLSIPHSRVSENFSPVGLRMGEMFTHLRRGLLVIQINVILVSISVNCIAVLQYDSEQLCFLNSDKKYLILVNAGYYQIHKVNPAHYLNGTAVNI